MKKIILLFWVILYAQGIYAHKKNVPVSDLKGEQLSMYNLLKRTIKLKSQDSTSIHFFTTVIIEENREYYSMKTFLYNEIRFGQNYRYDFYAGGAYYLSATYSGELIFKKKIISPNNGHAGYVTNRPSKNRNISKKKPVYKLNVAEMNKYSHLRTHPSDEHNALLMDKHLFSISSDEPFYQSKYQYKVLFKYRKEGNKADAGLYKTLAKGDSSNNYDHIYILNTRDYSIVRSGYKSGVINRDNQVIIPLTFKALEPITYDIFFVRQGDKYGCLNLKNEYVLELKYDFIRPLNSRILGVKSGDFWGIYNLELNSFVTKFEFDTFSEHKGDELIIIQKGEKFGAIDINGNIKIPIEYNQIQYVRKLQHYKAIIKGKVKIYSLKGEIIEQK